ncbi:hypothetical protein DT144_25100 [Salmonella enterica subsp. enterica]|nr:hypothetical protein [Salmonella enterica subsp. enterica]EGG4121087.1 hypothetical protein [Salmonella enterica]EGG4135167.1 hypothetical protein [Salmonella enterica]
MALRQQREARLLSLVAGRTVQEYVYYPQSFEPLALIRYGRRWSEKDGFSEPKKRIYFYHNDVNGAPLRLTDESGGMAWSQKAGPWGAWNEQTGSVRNPLRFQGQYFDEESGLHYNRYRYYEPESGRYISADPLKLGAGLNLYQYAPNSLGWIDPLGLKCSILDDIIADANKAASKNGRISDIQAKLLRDNLPIVQRRSAFQNKMARAEFVKNQNYLMKQWEQYTGKTWPAGATPHHIIPLESGGANKWWNLMPTHGALPNHSLPGVPGPHAAGGALRTTIQQGRKALPPGTVTDIRL